MRPNLQETEDLVTFTEEILNRKLHFLCCLICNVIIIKTWICWSFQVKLEIFCNQILRKMTHVQLLKLSAKLIFHQQILLFYDPFFTFMIIFHGLNSVSTYLFNLLNKALRFFNAWISYSQFSKMQPVFPIPILSAWFWVNLILKRCH